MTNIHLDDAQLDYADFSYSNLTGANLSEASLKQTRFIQTDLYNACFAYSSLEYADFSNACFGSTDITGVDLSFSKFSGLSCFTLNFFTAQKLDECTFININGQKNKFSSPPIVIKGLQKNPIILMKHGIQIGTLNIEYGYALEIICALQKRLMLQ